MLRDYSFFHLVFHVVIQFEILNVISSKIEHCKLIYIGNLGEMVLKLRMPTITKEQLKLY